MTNILTDVLPTSIIVAGESYEISTDFRTCLQILLAFEDSELAGVEKISVFFLNMFGYIPEKDQESILRQGMWFLGGGGKDEPDGDRLKLFSWGKDANMIYSAFNQTHRIDLQEIKYMHWWKFLALFMDLGADTVFCNLVGLRQRVKTGKASKEERQAARNLGDMFIIEEIDDRTLEEKEAEQVFMDMVHQNRGERK